MADVLEEAGAALMGPWWFALIPGVCTFGALVAGAVALWAWRELRRLQADDDLDAGGGAGMLDRALG